MRAGGNRLWRWSHSIDEITQRGLLTKPRRRRDRPDAIVVGAWKDNVAVWVPRISVVASTPPRPGRSVHPCARWKATSKWIASIPVPAYRVHELIAPVQHVLDAVAHNPVVFDEQWRQSLAATFHNCEPNYCTPCGRSDLLQERGRPPAPPPSSGQSENRARRDPWIWCRDGSQLGPRQAQVRLFAPRRTFQNKFSGPGAWRPLVDR